MIDLDKIGTSYCVMSLKDVMAMKFEIKKLRKAIQPLVDIATTFRSNGFGEKIDSYMDSEGKLVFVTDKNDKSLLTLADVYKAEELVLKEEIIT